MRTNDSQQQRTGATTAAASAAHPIHPIHPSIHPSIHLLGHHQRAFSLLAPFPAVLLNLGLLFVRSLVRSFVRSLARGFGPSHVGLARSVENPSEINATTKTSAANQAIYEHIQVQRLRSLHLVRGLIDRLTIDSLLVCFRCCVVFARLFAVPSSVQHAVVPAKPSL